MSPDTLIMSALTASGALFAFHAMCVTAQSTLSQVTINFFPFVLAILDLGIVGHRLLA